MFDNVLFGFQSWPLIHGLLVFDVGNEVLIQFGTRIVSGSIIKMLFEPRLSKLLANE